MQGFLIVVGILLGLLGIVESGRCISEDEIDKLIERKMETAMKKYDRKIALLEEKIHSHEKKIRTLEEKRSSLGAEEEGKNSIRFHTVNKQDTNTILQKNPEQKPTNGHVAMKRIVPGTSDIVAFCAYMSTSEANPSLHHVLVFDNVQTNFGSAYDRISGMFTAPADGVYVFTCTIFSDRHSFIYSQMVVNTQPFTNMITDSDEVSDFHSSTGVIVVSLNRGDKVYIRTHPTYLSHGSVHSGVFGNTLFNGWKL